MLTETWNDAIFYQSYEIIGGEKFMAPSAAPTHGAVIGRLYAILLNHLEARNLGYVFVDDVDIHFPDGSLYKPDLVVILEENSSIIDWRKGIYGVPDMVVEILSYSTRKKDLTIKKDTYEAQGVREYWIIDTWAKIVDVYLLRDGKYSLSDEYMLPDEKDLEFMTEDERAAVKNEVPVSILDGLKVPLKYIFKWGYK